MMIVLRGVKELQHALTYAANLTTQDLVSDVAARLQASTRQRITETKTDPNGRKWEPWSPNYARTRKAKHSLLISSGDLRDSIKRVNVGSNRARVGTSIKYARLQQEGNDTTNLPARPFMGVSRSDLSEIHDAIEDFVLRKMFR